MNTYTFAVYGKDGAHGFVVLESPVEGRYQQNVVEDSGAIYELPEDAMFVAKSAIEQHKAAGMRKTPEYQEFLHRFDDAE